MKPSGSRVGRRGGDLRSVAGGWGAPIGTDPAEPAGLGLHGGEVSVGVKVPVTRAAVLALPKAAPMGYGLGKSGWVSIRFGPSEGPPPDTIKRWVMESYSIQASKRLLRALEAAQPWVAAGTLPR